MAAKVRVDIERVCAQVDPMIYGQFIEHMGRAIYGGVYDPGNPLSDAEGFRRDVLAKIGELAPPVLRWPGGNFCSGYHWLDGVGPRERRPSRAELAWQTVESNQFGTHEFIALCRKIGAEPYICVNMGWGTPEEAVNWLEYCNSDADTFYASLRRKNGAKHPFGVIYWGLGNEIYGTWQHGHCEPEEYAHKAAETAKMMKRLDPHVRFIFCGANDFDWDRRVLEYLYRKGYASLVNYISLHRYDGCPTYYGALFATMDFEHDIVACKGLLAEIAKRYHPPSLPKIAFDEWNVWFRKTGDRQIAARYMREGEDLLEEFYNLRDALYVGSVLNIFIRNSDVVTMANMAQLVNVIAPIFATPQGSYRQPIFFPLKYYRAMHRELALDVYVESDTIVITPELEAEQWQRYEFEIPPHWKDIDLHSQPWAKRGWYGREFPLIDVAATRSKDSKKVVLSIVNRHERDDQQVEVNLFDYAPTTGQTITITGPEPTGYMLRASGPNVVDNEYDEGACTVVKSELKHVGSCFSLAIPAHSLTIVSLQR